MSINSIYLKSAKRLFWGTFPLESVGIIENHPYCETSVQGRLEFCIRLGSTEFCSHERFGGEEKVLKYPNVAIKLPEVRHDFRIDHPRDAIFFRYDPSLAEAMKEAGLLTCSDAWSFTMKPPVSKKLCEVRELMRSAKEPGIADQLDLLAVQLLETLLLDRQLQPDEQAYVEGRLQKIATWLQLNVNRPVDIARLAAQNGFSPRNFFRCWKRYFPLSPAQYVKELKLQEAVRLLKETDLTVEAIARELGYRTTGYFCQQFQVKHGQTPLKFRQRNRREERRQFYWAGHPPASSGSDVMPRP